MWWVMWGSLQANCPNHLLFFLFYLARNFGCLMRGAPFFLLWYLHLSCHLDLICVLFDECMPILFVRPAFAVLLLMWYLRKSRQFCTNHSARELRKLIVSCHLFKWCQFGATFRSPRIWLVPLSKTLSMWIDLRQTGVQFLPGEF